MTVNINTGSSLHQLGFSNQISPANLKSTFDNFKSRHSGSFNDLGIQVNISASYNSNVTSSIVNNGNARVPNSLKANPYVHVLDSLRVSSLI